MFLPFLPVHSGAIQTQANFVAIDLATRQQLDRKHGQRLAGFGIARAVAPIPAVVELLTFFAPRLHPAFFVRTLHSFLEVPRGISEVCLDAEVGLTGHVL